MSINYMLKKAVQVIRYMIFSAALIMAPMQITHAGSDKVVTLPMEIRDGNSTNYDGNRLIGWFINFGQYITHDVLHLPSDRNE